MEFAKSSMSAYYLKSRFSNRVRGSESYAMLGYARKPRHASAVPGHGWGTGAGVVVLVVVAQAPMSHVVFSLASLMLPYYSIKISSH